MNGEETLNYVRRLTNDHLIGDYFHINRALREYCQFTGFPWLHKADEAAVTFKANQSTYILPELGFRRIDRIWVRGATDNKWVELIEDTVQSFEDASSESITNTGTSQLNMPRRYRLIGETFTVTPIPDREYQGRIDGVVNTPVVERLKRLPGPDEYHELVAILASGFHLLDVADQASAQRGTMLIQQARERMSKAAKDSKPNRTGNLSWPKQKLMR